MSTTSLWIFGCLGGLLPVIVRIAKSATSTDVPNFYKWWLIPASVASAFLGGLLVNLLDLHKAAELTGFSQKFTVILVGYAAPNILGNLAGVAAEKVAPAPAPAPAAAVPAGGPGLAPGAPTFARFLRA
jgi:hypothetical protein